MNMNKKRCLDIKKFDNKRINKKCFICDKTYYTLEIHHKNKNPIDDRKENLLIICSSCHHLIHNNKEIDKDLPTKKRMLIKKFRKQLFDSQIPTDAQSSNACKQVNTSLHNHPSDYTLQERLMISKHPIISLSSPGEIEKPDSHLATGFSAPIWSIDDALKLLGKKAIEGDNISPSHIRRKNDPTNLS